MSKLQFPLSVKPEMIEVDPAVIRAQPSMTTAIVLCQTLAGLEDKELCGDRGIVKHPEQWSRIKNGSAAFPHDKLECYFDRCRNEAPLFWLAWRRGYGLHHLESEIERQLRIEREGRLKAEERLAYLEGLYTKR